MSAIINNTVTAYPKLSSMLGVNDHRFVLERLHDVLSRGINGDIVEMGCNVGTMTVYLLGLLKALGINKKVYAVDSFNGLPDKTPEDLSNPECNKSNGGLKCKKDVLVKNISDAGLSDNLVILKGWFSEITGYPDRVCFAFFDGDLYQSIMDSFNIIYPRMVPGGIICVHDYKNSRYPGVKSAVRDFLEDKLENVENEHDVVCTIKIL